MEPQPASSGTQRDERRKPQPIADLPQELLAPCRVAECARANGAEDMRVLLALRPLLEREQPLVHVPTQWSENGSKLAFLKAVITMAGMTTRAYTLAGYEAKAQEALLALAQAEQETLWIYGKMDLAFAWKQCIDRARARLSQQQLADAHSLEPREDVSGQLRQTCLPSSMAGQPQALAAPAVKSRAEGAWQPPPPVGFPARPWKQMRFSSDREGRSGFGLER